MHGRTCRERAHDCRIDEVFITRLEIVVDLNTPLHFREHTPAAHAGYRKQRRYPSIMCREQDVGNTACR